MEMTKMAFRPTFTIEDYREVWALVTKHPNISLNRLAEAIGKKRGYVRTILKHMERVGLLEHPERNIRVITVPMDTR